MLDRIIIQNHVDPVEKTPSASTVNNLIVFVPSNLHLLIQTPDCTTLWRI